MNEPHILDISTWAGSVQAAVTAIRAAGASTNKILMPGTGFAAAGSFIDTGSGVALLGVVDHDNSTDNLIFDVHQYLDDNFSGTNAECARGNVEAFERLGEWLRNYKRQAMLTETGGGAETDSCLKNFCKQLATLNEYSDVYLGWVGWSAGSFSADKEEYVLTERPKGAKGHFEDQRLVSECIVGQFIL